MLGVPLLKCILKELVHTRHIKSIRLIEMNIIVISKYRGFRESIVAVKHRCIDADFDKPL